jgi:hypothetical protein
MRAVNFSRKLLLLTAVLLTAFCCSNLAVAQAWLKVTSGQTTTLYVDPASIVRTKSKVKATELADFNVNQMDRSGFSYRSQITYNEIDCERHLVRMLSQSQYLGSLGLGKQMKSTTRVGAWATPIAGSIGDVFMRELCITN